MQQIQSTAGKVLQGSYPLFMKKKLLHLLHEVIMMMIAVILLCFLKLEVIIAEHSERIVKNCVE